MEARFIWKLQLHDPFRFAWCQTLRIEHSVRSVRCSPRQVVGDDPDYFGRYAPQTLANVSEISPTLARAFTASMMIGMMGSRAMSASA